MAGQTERAMEYFLQVKKQPLLAQYRDEWGAFIDANMHYFKETEMWVEYLINNYSQGKLSKAKQWGKFQEKQ